MRAEGPIEDITCRQSSRLYSFPGSFFLCLLFSGFKKQCHEIFHPLHLVKQLLVWKHYCRNDLTFRQIFVSYVFRYRLRCIFALIGESWLTFVLVREQSSWRTNLAQNFCVFMNITCSRLRFWGVIFYIFKSKVLSLQGQYFSKSIRHYFDYPTAFDLSLERLPYPNMFNFDERNKSWLRMQLTLRFLTKTCFQA